MPGFSRISLSSVSCSYSPNRRSGPLLRERGLTSPVSSNIFKYRLTVRSETLSCWPISCGEACQARAIQIIRHRKSREYGIGMTNQKTVLLLFGFTGADNLGQSSSNMCACVFGIGQQTWKFRKFPISQNFWEIKRMRKQWIPWKKERLLTKTP